MQATRTLTLDEVALDGGLWVLTVVHHPDPTRLGGRVVIPCGEALTLGRDAAAGGGLLDDPSVSRRHARLEGDDAALRVTDLGSSNGTWRGDARVTEAAFTSGETLRLGGILLLARRVERAPADARDAGFPAFSEAMARVAAALADVPAGARAVVLHGGPAAGVDAVASALAARAPEALPVLPLPAAAPPVGAREALFERAHGRTALLGALPLADAAWQDDVVTWACSDRAPRLLVLWWPDQGRADEAVARDALARALGARVVALPALRDRAEDLPHLVRELALRVHGRAPRLHHALAAALLRAPWPDDLLGLTRFVHAHLAPTADDVPLALTPAMEAALGPSPAPATPPATTEVTGPRVTVLARDALWFQAPGEAAVSLAGRFALARVLRVLVDARVERPGRGTDVDAIVRAAWSGQRMVEDSGTHRAYVAVSSLRRLGLVDVLTRNEEGYLLDPRATRVSDEPR
jgi:hypothetical protein